MQRQVWPVLGWGFSLAIGVLLAQSIAIAACPPASSGSTTIIPLTPCCDYIFSPAPCGVDPSRIEISGTIITPTAVITPDSGNPNHVHITRTTSTMTVTGYGACTGLQCPGPGLNYNFQPYQSDSLLINSSLSWTRGYPSSAWIGGDPDFVDLTKMTPNQCNVKNSWSMGNNAAINLPDMSETFDLGCAPPPITKPTPKPPMAQCPVTPNPSDAKCQGGKPDPVDPYSGDYYYAETDLSVPGIIPLAVVRAYTSSQSGFTGPFGVGTYLKTYNYSIAVPLNGDGTVNTSANQQVQMDDGSGLLMPLDNGSSGGLTFTNNAELGTTGSALVLTLDGSNHLASAVYTTPDHTQFHFDADGHLSSLEDDHGNTISLTRGTGGRLEGVSLLGRSLSISYNGGGLIESIQDHTGRTVHYAYSPNNELLRVKNPDSKDETYTWDSLHRVQSLVDYSSNIRFLNFYAANGMIKQQALKMGGGADDFRYLQTGRPQHQRPRYYRSQRQYQYLHLQQSWLIDRIQGCVEPRGYNHL